MVKIKERVTIQFKEGYVSYGEREGWSDIEPLKQDDGDNPVVPIAYAPEYVDTMDYFRAIAKKEEISLRALEITSEVIRFNPSHYTVWLYRQKIVSELDIDIQSELDFVTDLVIDNPKCYQLWQHRQFLVERSNDFSQELEFLEQVFEDDSKNFHAWSYRQWLIKKFNLWDQELKFTDILLGEDIRNNSVWNQRFFTLTQNPGSPLNEDILLKELEFVVEKIKYVSFNLSPYNYAKGLINKFYKKDVAWKKLKVLADRLKQENVKSKPLLAWYVDIAVQCKKEKDVDEEVLEEGLECCEKLIGTDLTRSKFWNYKKAVLNMQ